MSRWLTMTIAGLVLSIALGAGATVAVLAATSGGDEDLSSPPARALVEDEAERSWLGVIVGGFGDEGVVVQQVFADDPAHRAGLKRGDVIKAFDDQDVRTVADLVACLNERKPGDEVTLTVLRDDEEMALQVTLGARPGPLRLPQPEGPFAELGELEFGDVLGGEFRIKDDEGNTLAIEVVVGNVASLSDDELTVNANDGSERTFTITDDTVMPQRPEVGDPIVVVTLGDSEDARLVLPGGVFHLQGMFERLREHVRERFIPPEVPWLDIPPCLEERPLEPMPGPSFRLRPEWSPELMPLPESERSGDY